MMFAKPVNGTFAAFKTTGNLEFYNLKTTWKWEKSF
jgi:hypothetical protein